MTTRQVRESVYRDSKNWYDDNSYPVTIIRRQVKILWWWITYSTTMYA